MSIGVTGFEPATSWSRTKRSTKLSYTPDIFSPDCDLSPRRPLYQSELHPGLFTLIPTAICRRGDRSTKLSYTPVSRAHRSRAEEHKECSGEERTCKKRCGRAIWAAALLSMR
jgi:hypothetical protein